MVQVLGRGICTLSEANWFRTTSHGPVYRGMLIPEAATYDEEMHWLASMHEPWISACSPNRIRGKLSSTSPNLAGSPAFREVRNAERQFICP